MNDTAIRDHPSNFAQNNNSATTPGMAFTSEGILKATAVGVLIIVAIIGNLMVCVSFALYRNLRSLTNYFIVSLSVADFLIATSTMPFWFGVQLYRPRIWMLTPTTVKFWHTMDLFLCIVSVFSLTAISMERNLAITNPFCYTKWLSPTRVLVALAALWFCAITIAMIATANIFGKSRDAVVFIVIASYVLPLLVLVKMYTNIFIVARRQTRRLRQDGAFATDMKAIKVIAIVIGAFVVCYTPYYVIFVCVHFSLGHVTADFVTVTKWLTYCNSCLNPIIYSCFNKTYRKSFKRLFQDLGKQISELQGKLGTRKVTLPQPVQRSHMSLNNTMRSSAGSLLDGPKATTDIFPLEQQSRAAHVATNSRDQKSQKLMEDVRENSRTHHASVMATTEMETSK